MRRRDFAATAGDKGVLHKIAHGPEQHFGIAECPDLMRVTDEFQRLIFGQRGRRHQRHHLCTDFIQVYPVAPTGAEVLQFGQLQQLIQDMADGIYVGLQRPGGAGIQHGVDMGAQNRQRCAQLMCRIGGEFTLRLQSLVQPVERLVDRFRQQDYTGLEANSLTLESLQPTMTMTKRDLVIRISTETGLVQQQVLDVVQKTLDYIAEAVSKGDKVELRNFGVFEVKVRKARIGRNPNAPATDVPIPQRAVVKFKPGKEMRAEVLKLTPDKTGNGAPATT